LRIGKDVANNDGRDKTDIEVPEEDDGLVVFAKNFSPLNNVGAWANIDS
jgi:hypothetical protein